VGACVGGGVGAWVGGGVVGGGVVGGGVVGGGVVGGGVVGGGVVGGGGGAVIVYTARAALICLPVAS
jgi:hypothetical protein